MYRVVFLIFRHILQHLYLSRHVLGSLERTTRFSRDGPTVASGPDGFHKHKCRLSVTCPSQRRKCAGRLLGEQMIRYFFTFVDRTTTTLLRYFLALRNTRMFYSVTPTVFLSRFTNCMGQHAFIQQFLKMLIACEQKGFGVDFDNSLQMIHRFRSDDERINLECLQEVSSLLDKLI